jgi:23S rRNA (guanosine2251-2'-O)-methyltransferase
MSYLTGFHAIEEWLKSGNRAGPLLVAKAGPRANGLITLAVDRKVRIDRVGTFDLDRLAPGHRGIALLIEDRSEAATDLAGFLAGLGDRGNVLVAILDEITDPHNYGAILRSCDQFGVDLVLTRNRRIAKYADVVAKTSAGAVSWVRVAEVANLPRAVADLKAAGFWVYGADMAGEPVFSRDLRGRIALILGGEAGLSRLLRESADGLVSIPTKGRIDSLNVSVAAGILFYEVLRNFFTSPPGPLPKAETDDPALL